MSTVDTTNYDSTDLNGFYSWTETLRGIQYGPGCLETALPKFLDLIGAKKALIVTGRSLYEKTDVVKQVEAVLMKRDAYGGVFFEIGQHSPIAGIRKAQKLFKEAGADVIVAVGGGSPIDASKAILYNLQKENGGPLLKQIAIPTTLSAAEYTAGAGFTNDEGHKIAVADPQLAPSAIILDAKLTLATPERLWLSTGMRAVDHAVENLYRPQVPPPLKHLGYAALADLFVNLPLSKANPEDVNVRQKLQIAAWMSLWPQRFEKYSAVGLSHSLGHKLGATYSIPHGITSCLTLAPVVALKAETASREDKEWLANALFYLRIPPSGSIDKDILILSDAIRNLVRNLGLASTLAEYKVPKEDLPLIAEKALGRADDPVHSKVVKLLESLY
ncbi:alcohol dehydrogenase IV [Phanerochaete sordida]|uniref:Alcohol dehydrogenase IV n=1 Tax=Phanerochaete sordida TaxID=48140 RepID=A0A9P3GLV0_9APHY|nr:alcohol dehydrogenase IV [Phanerochaete sordida]